MLSGWCSGENVGLLFRRYWLQDWATVEISFLSSFLGFQDSELAGESAVEAECLSVPATEPAT